MKSNEKEELWKQFFRNDYLKFSQTILSLERTQFEIEQLIELLKLPQNARILDLGCGQGRISIPLAKKGYQVTAMDGSLTLLNEAKRVGHLEGVDIHFVLGDMRSLSFMNEFDVVLNLGTAFGYIEDSSDERIILQRVCDALKTGGTFIQDLENRERKIRGYVHRTWDMMNGRVLRSERSFNPLTGRWRENIEWMEENTPKSAVLDVKLYSAVEIIQMTEEAGLTVQSVYGGFDWSNYDLDSVRMIIRSIK